jgi:hypothetical protein
MSHTLRAQRKRSEHSLPFFISTQNCTLGKHEAVVRVLYAFIADLVPHLTPPLRLFLFSRIAALPFHRYDHHTLQVRFMLYG